MESKFDAGISEDGMVLLVVAVAQWYEGARERVVFDDLRCCSFGVEKLRNASWRGCGACDRRLSLVYFKFGP